MTPKCSQGLCNLRGSCQRFDVEGGYVPIMPFLISMENVEGPFNGCADYWPVGTGPEYFRENQEHKTPVKSLK